MNSIEKLVGDVVVLARSLVQRAQQEVPSEKFIDGAAKYLEKFSQLNAELGAIDDLSTVADSVRTQLAELLELHVEVLRRVGDEKDIVAAEMVDLQKRSQAFRAYIDRFPNRISVTGKREG